MADKKFEIKKGPNFDKVTLAIGSLGPEFVKVAEVELKKTAIGIRNHMIEAIKNTPKTGRRYKRTKRKGVYHIASSPGRAPATMTGALRRSIKMDVRNSGFMNLEIEVGSNIKEPKYPVWLEEGTTNMAARPYLEPAYVSKTRFLEDRIMRAINKASKKKS